MLYREREHDQNHNRSQITRVDSLCWKLPLIRPFIIFKVVEVDQDYDRYIAKVTITTKSLASAVFLDESLTAL